MPLDEEAADRVAPLDAHLGFWLRQVSNHVSQAFARKVEATGVTVAEWVILRELYDLPAGASPSRLATLTGLTRGAVSKLVERLVTKALVSRSSVAGDRRLQEVRLTPDAVALVPRLASLADANDAECFDVLAPDEQAALMGLLKTISARKKLSQAPID
jgi:DNA-binding MarR family transcriptional regulator